MYRLKQCLRAGFEKFSTIIADIGFQRHYYDHSKYVLHMTIGIALFTTYADDILFIQSRQVLIETKDYFKQYFVTKHRKKLRYLLRIEVAYQKNELISLKKYMLDLFQEAGLLGYKLVSTIMEVDINS